MDGGLATDLTCGNDGIRMVGKPPAAAVGVIVYVTRLTESELSVIIILVDYSSYFFVPLCLLFSLVLGLAGNLSLLLYREVLLFSFLLLFTFSYFSLIVLSP